MGQKTNVLNQNLETKVLTLVVSYCIETQGMLT